MCLETFMKLVSRVTTIHSIEELPSVVEDLTNEDGLKIGVKAFKKKPDATVLDNDSTVADGFQKGDANATLDLSKSASRHFPRWNDQTVLSRL